MQSYWETTGPRDGPYGNRVLDALPPAEWRRSGLLFERVALEVGQVLCEPGVTQAYVVFPDSAIVSMSYITDSGAATEIAMVGDDGFVGAGLLLGGGSTTSRAEVQVAGHGYRVRAKDIEAAFNRSEPVRELLLLATQAQMTQMAQAAVCARHHVVEQRLCRLLLQRMDCLRRSELDMTQARIADALGVRRESVTVATLELQAAGLLQCSRGHITVLDRMRLEQRSCECYAVVKRECERLLPAAPSTLHAYRAERPICRSERSKSPAESWSPVEPRRSAGLQQAKQRVDHVTSVG